MRLFYSNADCTSGQLVIASPDSHYKVGRFYINLYDEGSHLNIIKQVPSLESKNKQQLLVQLVMLACKRIENKQQTTGTL